MNNNITEPDTAHSPVMAESQQDARRAALDAIRQKLGEKGYRESASSIPEFSVDMPHFHEGSARFVALPANVQEVAFVLKSCNAAAITVVPQGGNTGLCGGQVPDSTGEQLVINLRRMNGIHAIDVVAGTALVDAGVILQNLHDAVEAKGAFFPLSLGAKGICQIGGNIATNAGGINVVKYGNMRDLVLGLEVVLPDGRIINDLSPLRKDNTGYDLKQLFIGSEGTLGIITKASLKLFPNPVNKATAMVGLTDLPDVLALFAMSKKMTGAALNSFELVSDVALAKAATIMGEQTARLETACQWYVMMEITSADEKADMDGKLAALLEQAFDKGLVTDGIVAQNIGQRESIWGTRESIPFGMGFQSHVYDVSVPIADIPAFIAEADAACREIFPDAEFVTFGHVGDGNIHYNLVVPGRQGEALDEDRRKSAAVVHEIIARYHGSYAAEHGIGTAKRAEFYQYKDPVMIEMMQAVKRVFDPVGIMNPKTIFRP